MAMDFGFGTPANVEDNNGVQEEKTELNGGAGNSTESNGNGSEEGTQEEETQTEGTEKGHGENDSQFEIEPGTQIEFEGKNYVVDYNGNIVDEQGNIFKEVKDVKEWKNSLDISDDDNSNIIDFNSIHDAIGIDIVDEEGNVIEFQNTTEGIKSYVTQVIENEKEQNMKDAVDMLFSRYPIISDVLNYYLANGNSLEGFGEIPDRSNITIDDNNIEQQELIIKTAWKEQGRRGDVNAYIDYLKSSGTLATVAKEELEGLKEVDNEIRTNMERQAKAVEEAQIKEVEQYWNQVSNVIKTKKLGEYNLPDTIIRNVNGQKIAGSLDDFFNYIYRVDKDGNSAYVNDLAKEKPEDRLNDELLRAYLKYTGGNYESLVNMKVNEQKVKQLKLTSKNNAKKPAKFVAPVKKSDKIDFGI